MRRDEHMAFLLPALAAPLVAAAIGAVLLFAPLVSRTSARTDGGSVITRTERVSLVRDQGARAVVLAVLPLPFAALPLAVRRTRYARPVTFAAAGVLFALVAVALASVGLLYVPVATLVLVAALQEQRH